MEAPAYLHSDNPRVPAVQHPFYHRQPIQMRFTDLDMFGHVNNNVYLAYADLAKVHYFGAVNASDEPIVEKIEAVVVHIDSDFYAPSYYGEHLEVWTAVTSISKHSFRIEQRIVNSATGETKCIVRTVMAGFDPKTATSKPISDEWVCVIEAYEHRKLGE